MMSYVAIKASLTHAHAHTQKQLTQLMQAYPLGEEDGDVVMGAGQLVDCRRCLALLAVRLGHHVLQHMPAAATAAAVAAAT